MFAPIYVDEVFPVDGYDGLCVRVLANPSWAVVEDWINGHLGTLDCSACAAARGEPPDPAVYCPACAEARARYGRAMAAYLGKQATGFEMDFSTPEAALATLERKDVPGEVTSWLVALPEAIRQRRLQEIKKKLLS